MKLAEALRIAQSPAAGQSEPFGVFLATGFEPLHLPTFLTAHLRQRLGGRPVNVISGVFGDLFGNIERLSKSDCPAAATVIEWPDLDPRLGLRALGGWSPALLSDIGDNVEKRIRQLVQALASAAASKPIAVSFPTLPLPPISYRPSVKAEYQILAIHEALARGAREAAEAANLAVLDPTLIDALSPITNRRDVKTDLAAGFPYSLSHSSVTAMLLAKLIQPDIGKKGLITDLDDTLWRGILGDEGVEGITWNLDQRSHIHALYQQLLAALADSGVLLAVASKNDPELTQQALARHDLILPKDRLYPVEAGWGRKSESVSRILDTWNVSAESVVFVDDSPLDLEEVKLAHPLIECCLFPPYDDQAAYGALEKLRDLFGKDRVGEEDALRVESIRHRPIQPRAAHNGLSSDDFLAQINSELTFFNGVNAKDGRALELLNKTNQFNLNGRRYTAGEFQTNLRRPNNLALVVSYQDKFGPLGKIAVVVGEKQDKKIRLDAWVMSCRAFSRRIEYATLDFIFTKHQVDEIELEFQRTDRNGPLREFLEQFAALNNGASVRLSADEFRRLSRPYFAQISESSNE